MPYCVPDGKLRGANMGPIWGRQDPGGPYVGSMNLAFWGIKGHLNMVNAWHLKVEDRALQCILKSKLIVFVHMQYTVGYGTCTVLSGQ